MKTPAITPAVRKGFFRRLISWRGVLFLLAAFVTLVALLLAEENWRGARAWQNYKREMEGKGESFDAARLIPPKVPDDQNFGMTPLFAPIFNLPPGDPGLPLKSVTNVVHGESYGSYAAANRGTNLALPLLFGLNVNHPPHPLGWNYGMAADLPAWAAAIEGANPASPLGKVTDPVQAASIVLDNMKNFEPTLMELQSDTERRYCRFNIAHDQWGKPEAFQVSMEHFVLIKWLFWALNLHAEAEMVSGHTDQALNDINVMFRIDDGLKDEPLLMSQLVRLACVEIMLQPVGEGLAEHRWSEAQLRVLQERLQKTDLIASIVQAWYGERDIVTNPTFDRGNLNPHGWDAMPRGWVRLEQLNFNVAFHDTVLPRIDLAARVINPSVNHCIDLAFNRFSDGNWFHLVVIQHSIFAKMWLPAVSSHVPQKTAFAQSEVDMAMLACALERCRLAEGQYPEELNALVPRFVAVLPHDIINGQPLKYRLTDNGRFILYSVGWNEKDDGGVVATNKEKRQDILQGDWVWQYPDGN